MTIRGCVFGFVSLLFAAVVSAQQVAPQAGVEYAGSFHIKVRRPAQAALSEPLAPPPAPPEPPIVASESVEASKAKSSATPTASSTMMSEPAVRQKIKNGKSNLPWD